MQVHVVCFGLGFYCGVVALAVVLIAARSKTATGETWRGYMARHFRQLRRWTDGQEGERNAN